MTRQPTGPVLGLDSKRAGLGLLAGLVLLAAGRALANGFALDDLPIVIDNPPVRNLGPPWGYLTRSYWPSWYGGDAYRPWTVWWFALQHAVAGPTPWVFHLVNLLLALALVVVVYRLLDELVSPPAALAGAAVFAVHPVHVEA